MTDASLHIAARDYEPTFGDYFALLKPRVMSLVVFTALVGVLAAPAGLHWVEAACAILFIAIGAGASGALNMWWDADIDAVMKRTAKRPIPSGRVTGDAALSIGIGLSILSVMMLGLTTNWLAAGLLAFTIFFYAVVYSMWLKRSTPQNIVIGGAAGAFPPMIGWVAVTGSVSLEAVLMFAIIFLWTPPHFWALALFMRTDYDDAKVPMLTVTHGRRATRNHILAYTVIVAIFAIAAAFTTIGGPFYLAVAVIANAIWLRDAFRIWRRDEAASEADNFKIEKAFFKFSLLYLALHFVAIWVEAVLPQGAWGGFF
ncbi:MAG: heme o synthase [Pseudomonadota bacterium]